RDARPPGSLGHFHPGHRVRDPLDESLLRPLAFRLENRRVHLLPGPWRPAVMDKRPHTRTPVAVRRRAQPGPHARAVRCLSLRAPPDLCVDAVHVARHRLPDHADTRAHRRAVFFPDWPGDSRADRGLAAGVALRRCLSRLPAQGARLLAVYQMNSPDPGSRIPARIRIDTNSADCPRGWSSALQPMLSTSQTD